MSDSGEVKVVYIKKKAKGHAHYGGAWKVAYADFVTAMMALFIVLWLLTQTDQSSRERIAEYFRTGTLPGGTMVLGKPGGSSPPVPVDVFSTLVPQKSSDARRLEQLREKLEALLAQKASDDPALQAIKQHIKVSVVEEGALIEMVDGGDNFMFPVASAELAPNAVKFLELLAPMLATMRNQIEIHGHTDARSYERGTKKSNWELSFERANRARVELERAGVGRDKFAGVFAHADRELVVPGDPYAAENRRLSLLVVRSPFGRIMGEGHPQAPATPEGETGEGADASRGE